MMEDDLILVCKYGGMICPVLIKSGMDFAAVMKKVCKKWDELDPETLIMTYTLMNDESIVMEDDDDLKTLIELSQAGALNDIEVVVEDGSLEFTVDKPNTNSGRSKSQMSQSKKRMVTANLDDIDMVTPSFVSHKKRVLKSADWAYGIKGEGQCFVGGVQEFRDVLKMYCVERGIEYVLVKNDKERVTAHCKHRNGEKTCMWEVHGRVFKANGFFFIRKFVDEHKCGYVLRTTKNPRATFELIGSLIVEDVRAKSKKTPLDIITEMKREYGLDITYHQAWWAVERARGDVFGDFVSSFSSLQWYVRSARTTNPGSHIVLEVDEESKRFKRLFIAFRGCIDGFGHCRPILFLDGTFLKGRQKGHLLGATGKTGNQEIFPLCFAIIDSENHDNWLWFLQQLKSILIERSITFVSDRNLGLLEAMKTVFPTSPHGYCLFHLIFNLRYHLRGTPAGHRESLVWLLRQSAHAPTAELFQHYIYKMVFQGGARVQEFLKNLPVEHWSTVYFPGCRYGEMYSNVAESFNSWIKDERYLPVRNLVDAIRVKIMNMIVERRKKASEWVGTICPEPEQKLFELYQESRSWVVMDSGYGVYEVHSEPTVSVDIGRKTCSCKKWQQHGFPCCHAVGVIANIGKDLDSYVDPYYYTETYRASYSYSINPIDTVWMPRQTIEEDVILPPLSKKPPGRPKTRRIPSRGEKVSQIRCSRCHKLGNHNRTTCNEAM